jgi:hypothetical protein
MKRQRHQLLVTKPDDASHLRVTWLDAGREPQQPPNPAYPHGIDVDMTTGRVRGPSCRTALPYPARRIGSYVIECDRCRRRFAVTTAGRPDDPRSVILPCGPMAS